MRRVFGVQLKRMMTTSWKSSSWVSRFPAVVAEIGHRKLSSLPYDVVASELWAKSAFRVSAKQMMTPFWSSSSTAVHPEVATEMGKAKLPFPLTLFSYVKLQKREFLEPMKRMMIAFWNSSWIFGFPTVETEMEQSHRRGRLKMIRFLELTTRTKTFSKPFSFACPGVGPLEDLHQTCYQPVAVFGPLTTKTGFQGQVKRRMTSVNSSSSSFPGVAIWIEQSWQLYFSLSAFLTLSRVTCQE